MNEYKANSHKAKKAEEKRAKKVDKVVTGKVRTKKKSEMSKFKDVFISEDVSNVKSYIFLDVLIPTIKKALSDIIVNSTDMMLYGDTRDRKRSGSGNYRNYSTSGRRDDRGSSERRRIGYDFDDIILDSRGEAEEVLSRMDDLMDDYGVVSVADLYDLVGMSCNYTDNKYGWTGSLRTAEAVRVRDGGYMLKLPKAVLIE